MRPIDAVMLVERSVFRRGRQNRRLVRRTEFVANVPGYATSCALPCRQAIGYVFGQRAEGARTVYAVLVVISPRCVLAAAGVLFTMVLHGVPPGSSESPFS